MELSRSADLTFGNCVVRYEQIRPFRQPLRSFPESRRRLLMASAPLRGQNQDSRFADLVSRFALDRRWLYGKPSSFLIATTFRAA